VDGLTQPKALGFLSRKLDGLSHAPTKLNARTTESSAILAVGFLFNMLFHV
jgi:hypothetical protein